ncbi:MAG: uracil-DNA glycosylase [Betaproteobacteria bacterium]
MSLSRKQILDEMGLSPQWTLREEPGVARRAKTITEAQPAPRGQSPESSKPVLSEAMRALVTANTAQTERAASIAQMDWEALQSSAADCQVCGLCAERKQAVLGVGDVKAGWLFIGEGPGAEEDARGEPFVGPAGKLLDAMLAAIDLQRGEDVYIANAVKCRPPGNRTPEAAEIKACFPYLQRQIALIQPKLIVLLGRVAVSAVLGEEGALASLRGKSLVYRDGERDIPVLVTYHPAYLLRNLPDKAKAWEDLCRARALMRSATNQ